jgi:hypothetical protein
MSVITSAPRVTLPGDRHLIVGTDGGDLSLTVIDAVGATLVSLRIPSVSGDRNLFSVHVPGFWVAVYHSALGDELGPHTVVDLLTEEAGPIHHNAAGEPMLAVNINDGPVYEHTGSPNSATDPPPPTTIPAEAASPESVSLVAPGCPHVNDTASGVVCSCNDAEAAEPATAAKADFDIETSIDFVRVEYVTDVRALLRSGDIKAVLHAMTMTWHQLDAINDAGQEAGDAALATLDAAWAAALPPWLTAYSEPERLTLAANSTPEEPVFSTRAHSLWRLDRMPLLCAKLRAQHAAAQTPNHAGRLLATLPWIKVGDAIPTEDETILLAIGTDGGGPLNYSTGFWTTDGDRGYFVADDNGSDASNVVAWLALTPPTGA